MSKKISKFGNELGLTIEKSMLDRLGLQEGTELSIKTDGEAIIIKPLSKTTQEQDKKMSIKEAYEKAVEDYGDTLKKLSDN